MDFKQRLFSRVFFHNQNIRKVFKIYRIGTSELVEFDFVENSTNKSIFNTSVYLEMLTQRLNYAICTYKTSVVCSNCYLDLTEIERQTLRSYISDYYLHNKHEDLFNKHANRQLSNC